MRSASSVSTPSVAAPGIDAEGVPLVGVASRDPEHPRAMRRDEDRDPRLLDRARLETRIVELVEAALEGRPLLRHQQADDLDRLLEPVDPLRGRRQVDAVAAVLVLVPAGPDPEDQPPAADVVDGDRLLQQDRRMAERVARHEDAQADARRPRGDRRQQRPRLRGSRPRAGRPCRPGGRRATRGRSRAPRPRGTPRAPRSQALLAWLRKSPKRRLVGSGHSRCSRLR